MLGLKREIIKERDAVEDRGGEEERQRRFRFGDTEGDANRCNLDV